MIVLYPPENSVVPIPFATFAKVSGAPITATGFAVGDIKVFKNGNTPARSSTNGFSLADTDGIDFAGITGLHGFKIDLSDNSDAGFYTVGAWYWVGVSTITVDGETLSAWIAMFRIMEQENVMGLPMVDLWGWRGSEVPVPTIAGVPKVDTTHTGGSPIQQSGGVIDADVVKISRDGPAADALEAMLDGTGGVTIKAILDGTIAGIAGQNFPTNFAVMAIDELGIIDAHVKKVAGELVGGDGTVDVPWGPA